MNIDLLVTALVHTIFGKLRAAVPSASPEEHDRGAVSLEQVLWFVAAGVAVAVIAGILWSKIKTEANKSIQSPTAP